MKKLSMHPRYCSEPLFFVAERRDACVGKVIPYILLPLYLQLRHHVLHCAHGS